MIGVACNSRIPQASNFFNLWNIIPLADFIDKVTSRELFNITLKKDHLCYIVWNGYWIPFCFSSKGNLPPFGKKPKGVRYRMQNRKNLRNKNALHAGIWYLSAACKRDSDILMSCCKRLSVTHWILLHAESANCMQCRSCFAIYRTEKLNQIKKMEATFKIH